MSETLIDEGLKLEDIKGQVMNYVKKSLPVYKTWSVQNLKDHISFYLDLGQLIVSQKETGEVDGVMAFQLIDSIDERNSLKNNLDSLGVHIQIFVAESQKVRERLVGEAMAFTGVKQWISFERVKHQQRVSRLPWKLAEKIAMFGKPERSVS